MRRPEPSLPQKISKVLDDTLRETCNKVVAKIGREVCLWDAGTMSLGKVQ